MYVMANSKMSSARTRWRYFMMTTKGGSLSHVARTHIEVCLNDCCRERVDGNHAVNNKFVKLVRAFVLKESGRFCRAIPFQPYIKFMNPVLKVRMIQFF